MRVAPLGAYFADQPSLIRGEAELTAIVTHTHPDGVAGAVAVAYAAAIACRAREDGRAIEPRAFFDEVTGVTPVGLVRSGLERAAQLGPETSIAEAVAELGNGSSFLAADTVPFALWSAATSLSDFERALERTASGLGDADTNCAIVGGVVAAFVGREGLPRAWLQRREPLPDWIES